MESILDTGLEFSGRQFSPQDLRLILEVIRDFSALSLTELSSTLCELLEWKRANGKLKYKECRTLLERLQAEGLALLPALRKTAPFCPRAVAFNIQGNPQKPVTGSVGEYSPLLLRLVQGIDLSSLWNQFIDRYHYLRFRVPFGANLRYLVESERHPGRPLACLLFSSPAWKMTARDAWIGWTENERRRNLQYVVSNSRFLILPWVSIRGLASKILSLAARRLPGDWDQFYGYRPLLLETLVDPSRFRGTCYRAANWTYLGKTQGRGRMDRDHQAHGRAVKDLYVFPLCRAARRRLREAQPPKPIESPEVKEPADFNLLEEATRVELSPAVPVGGMVSVIDWQLLKQCRLPERPEQPSARRVRQKGRPPDPGS